MRKLQIEELDRPEVAAYRQQQKYPVALVLDNVRSMLNVGAAFRTADAFLVDKVWLCGITGKPPHREINKTALGATESVHWEHVPDTTDALQILKAGGYHILAVEQIDKAQPLQTYRFAPEQPYALVFGNEAFGMSDEALPFCDAALEIPQFGTKHSLNISVSVGIVLWEYLSQQI